MTVPTEAPWRLQGDCVVALARHRPGPCLPAGLARAPGPALVIAVRYVDSPVGPYHELAEGVPARLGARVGLCVTTMVVDSAPSRLGGVVHWGFPKELGTLRWSLDGDGEGVVVRWVERGIGVRARPRGRLRVPAAMPLAALQRRADGLVTVPGHVRGWARPARVTVEVEDPTDPLAPLAGPHWGFYVPGLRMVVDRAVVRDTRPAAVRAPLQPAEPALSSTGPAGD